MKPCLLSVASVELAARLSYSLSAKKRLLSSSLLGSARAVTLLTCSYSLGAWSLQSQGRDRDSISSSCLLRQTASPRDHVLEEEGPAHGQERRWEDQHAIDHLR